MTERTSDEKNRVFAFTLIFVSLFVTTCAKQKNKESALRETVTQYITTWQERNIEKIYEKVYELELPEYKARVSFENYKGHARLEEGLDSNTHYDFVLRNVELKGDTALVFIESHHLGTGSIQIDSLTAVFIGGRWYIPTYSSDVNQ